MSLWLAIPLGTGPCLLWLWMIHRHDDHEREPWWCIALAVLLGALSVLGVLVTRPWLESWFGVVTPVVDAFFVTALNEEMWKLAAFMPLLCMAELDEPLDGAVYGGACGLGFAGVENVIYSQYGCDVAALIQRGFTATLLHAACTGSLGFFCAMVKLHRVSRLTALWVLLGLPLAVLIHGLYDLFLDGDRVRAQVSLILVLPTALYLLVLKLRWARSRSPHYHPPS
ncbi:MAG: PrsW family intramembrane metalloprotease [bacterium]|nr:PrsW family intramembrane metalloprotease [bacterium]